MPVSTYKQRTGFCIHIQTKGRVSGLCSNWLVNLVDRLVKQVLCLYVLSELVGFRLSYSMGRLNILVCGNRNILYSLWPAKPTNRISIYKHTHYTN